MGAECERKKSANSSINNLYFSHVKIQMKANNVQKTIIAHQHRVRIQRKKGNLRER